MKKIQLIVFLIILLCLNGCLPPNNNVNNNVQQSQSTTLIRIEFANGKYVSQQVIQILRSARAADIEINKIGIMDDRMEARFRTLTKDKAQSLKQQLEQIEGVIYVEIIKDGMPTKNPFL